MSPAKRSSLGVFFAAIAVGTARAGTVMLPADPNNAALLYYQAFLLHPEVPKRIESHYADVLRGADPSEEIRRHLRRCRETIELVETAVRLSECDWGVSYSKGLGAPLPQLREGRRLASLLRVNAQVLAFDGDYDAALQQALVIRRLAEHLGHDTLVLHFAANSVDYTALLSIQHILGVMPPEARRLRWLKEQLRESQGAREGHSRALRMDVEMTVQSLRGTLSGIREELLELAEDDNSREAVRALTDQALIQRAREPYVTFLDRALQVMDSDKTYAQKHAEIESLGEELKTRFSRDPVALPLIIACPVEGLGEAEARHRAKLALFRAALEVYLAAAEPGRLPERLGDDWPKDPLTGEAFDYEITETGFVLRHQDRDIPGGGIHPFEFRVCDPNMLRQ